MRSEVDFECGPSGPSLTMTYCGEFVHIHWSGIDKSEKQKAMFDLAIRSLGMKQELDRLFWKNHSLKRHKEERLAGTESSGAWVWCPRSEGVEAFGIIKQSYEHAVVWMQRQGLLVREAESTQGKRKAMTIEVPGNPVAQPRVKVSTRGGFGRAYVDRKHPVHEYRQRVAQTWRDAVGFCFDGPLRVTIELVIERPKSVKRRWPTVKPDASNYAKAVEDCLNGVAWKDDSQIIELMVRKVYGEPMTRVSVEEVGR